jgi:hypothetical protein
MDYTTFLGIIDILYKLSILFISFVVILGYLYYLGYRERIEKRLEKSRPFIIRVRNAINGYIIFQLVLILLSIIFSVSIFLRSGESPVYPILINDFLIDTVGSEALHPLSSASLIVGLTFGLMTFYIKFKGIRGRIILIIFAFFAGFMIGFFEDVSADYLGIFTLTGLYLTFFLIIPFSIIRFGNSLADSLETEYKTVVKFKDGEPMKNLLLFQTTETDYRFIDELKNEYVIPISNVEKIFYEHQKEEKD